MGEINKKDALFLAREAITHSEWDASDEGEILAGKWDNAVAVRIAAHSARHVLKAMGVVTPAPSTIDRALFDEAVEALEGCRETLAMLTEPKEIRTTSVTHAWAQAVEAERKARAVLAKAREASK